MRPTRPIGTLIGMLAIAGVAAGCGASSRSASVAPRPPTPVASHPAAPKLLFLAPRSGASVGSGVQARVEISGPGHVRFVLDGGPPRLAAGTSISYRDLAPGWHRLVAQLLDSAGQATAATASVRFDVRRPPISHRIAPLVSSTASSSSTPAQTQQPATGASQASRPPPSTPPSTPTSSAPAPAPPPPPPSSPSPATPSHAGSGIPQGGGGDGDGDNHGGPSDGDGNV